MSDAPAERFDDATLVSYVDGTLDASARAAVESDPAAMARAAGLRAELEAVTEVLARSLCPDGDALADFLTAALDEAGERAIGAHVAWCATCGDELVAMRAFLRDVGSELGHAAVPADAGPRWSVARALGPAPSGAAAALAPPRAGVRGGASGARALEVDGWRLTLDVAANAQHPDRARVILLVVPPGDAHGGARVRAALVGSDGTAVEAELDALGEVTFDDLEPDVYSLMVDGGAAGRLLVPGVAAPGSPTTP